MTKLEQLEKAQDELRLRTLLWDSLDEWDKFLNETLVVRQSTGCFILGPGTMRPNEETCFI